MTEEIEEALSGVGADYMTSDQHHPGYVLIPTAKFEQLVKAEALLGSRDDAALGDPCTLESCPPGLFLADAYGTLGMKSEYHTDKGAVEAYVVESGEFFWGDNPQTVERQRAQIVRPISHAAILSKLKENGLSREGRA